MSTQGNKDISTGDPAVDRALVILRALRPPERSAPLQVTTGAGLAIAGAWIAGSAVTITLLILMFAVDPMTDEEWSKVGVWEFLMLMLMIASPMIAAYYITKVILSKDD